MEEEKTLLHTPVLLEEQASDDGHEFDILAINQDSQTLLIADYQSRWIDESLLTNQQLITHYKDDRSSRRQVTDWLLNHYPILADYIQEHQDDLFENPDHLQMINQELANYHQSLMIHQTQETYGPGELLAVVYDTNIDDAESLSYFLKHQLGAFYQDNLINVYQVPIAALEANGIEEAILGLEPHFFDKQLMAGDETSILRAFQLDGFRTVAELTSNMEEIQDRQELTEMERGI